MTSPSITTILAFFIVRIVPAAFALYGDQLGFEIPEVTMNAVPRLWVE